MKFIFLTILSLVSIPIFALTNGDQQALKKALWDKCSIDLMEFVCENGEVQKIGTYISYKDGYYVANVCEFKEDHLTLFCGQKMTNPQLNNLLGSLPTGTYATEKITGKITAKKTDQGNEMTVTLRKKFPSSHICPYNFLWTHTTPSVQATSCFIDFKKTYQSFRKSLTKNLECFLKSESELIDNILIPTKPDESAESYIKRLFSYDILAYNLKAFLKMNKMLNE